MCRTDENCRKTNTASVYSFSFFFFFCHCIVCPRFTTCDYFFGILKRHCMLLFQTVFSTEIRSVKQQNFIASIVAKQKQPTNRPQLKKSDRPRVNIWDTWKTLTYLNINDSLELYILIIEYSNVVTLAEW
jgi:hypothetical protein